MSNPGFLEGRAEARCVRDSAIAELRICRMAAGLQVTIIAVVIGLAVYSDPTVPAIPVLLLAAVGAFTTRSLVKVCRLGMFLRATIEAIGLFLEGRAAEAVRLFDLAKDESA